MYQFIINPNAQGGKGIKVWKKLERGLKRDGVDYHAYLTAQSGDARRLALQLTEEKKDLFYLVIVGGDGTLSEVVDGMSMSSSVTLGYLPVGFSLDFARSIRLPRNINTCIRHILNPKQVKMIDYGVVSNGDPCVRHRRFLINAGIGLNVSVWQHAFSLRTEKLLRFFHIKWLADFFVGMKQMIKFQPVKGCLILDGTRKVEFNRLYFISANIHPILGGGFKIAPKANYSDGKLAVCVIHSVGKMHLIPVCLRARLRIMGRDRGVRFYECKELSVHLEQPGTVQVDGESIGLQTEVYMHCIERKIRIIK